MELQAVVILTLRGHELALNPHKGDSGIGTMHVTMCRPHMWGPLVFLLAACQLLSLVPLSRATTSFA
jgi:hypothetical protein